VYRFFFTSSSPHLEDFRSQLTQISNRQEFGGKGSGCEFGWQIAERLTGSLFVLLEHPLQSALGREKRYKVTVIRSVEGLSSHFFPEKSPIPHVRYSTAPITHKCDEVKVKALFRNYRVDVVAHLSELSVMRVRWYTKSMIVVVGVYQSVEVESSIRFRNCGA
jgi:hypothetical protein